MGDSIFERVALIKILTPHVHEICIGGKWIARCGSKPQLNTVQVSVSFCCPTKKQHICSLLMVLLKSPYTCTFQGKNYLVGDNFTMADVFFYPYLAVIVRMGACLEKRYPALHRYHQALGERPSIKATQPPHWKDAPSQGLFYGLCDQQYM